MKLKFVLTGREVKIGPIYETHDSISGHSGYEIKGIMENGIAYVSDKHIFRVENHHIEALKELGIKKIGIYKTEIIKNIFRREYEIIGDV